MDKMRCPGCFREYEGAACPHCGYPEKGHNAAHQLPVGTVLRDRYQIGRALGQGGFGITYLAWDSVMRSTVAVKEFYPTGTVFRKSAVSLAVECGTEEVIPHYEYSKQRFLREAGALGRFRDIPEIVDILDFAEENNTSYIIMEYVRGVDLEKYIRMKGGKLSIDETFRILKPVMEALAKVHRENIIHRDISPDNIILDPMGGAKLLDFGAVRTVEDPDVDKGLNKSTEAILKQGFAPIEQYNTRGSLGPWTDEYALCATVLYCLTGTVPEEASIRMSEGIDPDWSSIEGLPEHQQKALEKGFSCRAKDRYKSVDELIADLFREGAERSPDCIPEKAPQPTAILPKETAPAMTGAAKAPKKRGKHIWAFAATAALLILLAVAVFIPKGVKSGSGETAVNDTETVELQTLPTETEETAPSTEPLSPEEEAYLHAEALLEEGKLGEAAIAFGKLSGFSDARERSFAIWDDIAIRDTISAGSEHTAGLRADGTVAAVGWNDAGECNVGGWTGMVAITAGGPRTLGLRADGTVAAAGLNNYGQNAVTGWTDIVAIAANYHHTVGLRADGTVVTAGRNDCGQCDTKGWTDVVAVSTGLFHTVGLRVDGTVVAVGENSYGQTEVSDWTDVVAIVAGYHHTVGLRADGTVVAAGSNEYGQCNVTGWTDVVAIDACWSHTVGLRADGTVVAAGSNDSAQSSVTGWTDVVAISAGYWHTVGLRADGTVVVTGSNGFGQCDSRHWTDIHLPYGQIPFR